MWSRHDREGLRDIIARTTCAKGQKRFKQCFTLQATHLPDAVLGYRITNHSFVASPERNHVVITGQYDGHVWYAYDRGNQTCVEKKTVCYTEHLPVVDLEGIRLCVGEHVQASVVKEPRILDVHVRRGVFELSANVEFYAEIIGEAKLWVKVFEPPECGEDKKDEEFALDEELAEFPEDDEDILDAEFS